MGWFPALGLIKGFVGVDLSAFHVDVNGPGQWRHSGVALFALGPSTGLAFAGSLLWGMGAALGFPVSMSAGTNEPARAAL